MAAETEPLEHVFTVIERQTLRGRMLDDYPLFLLVPIITKQL
jgi:hypothetical protein